MSVPHGVYAIYDRTTLADDALDRVDAVLAHGARWLQYRDKRPQAPDKALVAALASRTRAHGARLIINDDWRGRRPRCRRRSSRPERRQHRRRPRGPRPGRDHRRELLGRARARGQGVAEGASYVSFGRFFASRTKPDAPPADPAVLGAARAGVLWSPSAASTPTMRHV